MFSDGYRKELLFKIFQHLTLGGPLNQYEDTIGPYFDTTKLFYKSLIRCARDALSRRRPAAPRSAYTLGRALTSGVGLALRLRRTAAARCSRRPTTRRTSCTP